jgi:type IV pilus assembly protein PilZ
MSHARSADRRRQPRASLKIPVDYSSVDAFFTDFTRDINEGGVFIETDAPAEIDAEVQLHFKLPDEADPLRVIGRVAWVSDGKRDKPAGMGIEFQHLPEEMRQRINRIVRKLRRA